MPLQPECYECRLYQKAGSKNPGLEPRGAKNPKLYVLGNSPDKIDDKNGKIFSSPHSRVVEKMITDLGLRSKDVRFGTVIGCVPNRNKIEQNEMDFCKHRVLKDIQDSSPDVILALGEEAIKILWPNGFKGISTIARTRGNVVPYWLNGKLVPVVLTFSTTYMASGKSPQENNQVWIDDVGKAVDAVNAGVDEVFAYQLAVNAFEQPVEFIKVQKLSQLREFFAELKNAKKAAFDYETTKLKPWLGKLDERPAEIFSVAFAFDTGKVFSIPLFGKWAPKIEEEIVSAFGKWFTEILDDQIKIAHNLKFELLWSMIKYAVPYKGMEQEEITFCGNYQDTQLMAWLFDERPGASKLKIAAWQYLGVDDWSIEVNDIFKHTRDTVLVYNGLDAWYTLKLYDIFEQKLQEETSAKFRYMYKNLMLPATFEFMRVEARGCDIDEEKRQETSTRLKQKEEELLKEIRTEAGNENLLPSSTQQMSDYFANECGYKMLKKNKKGWSTDKATLDYLVETYVDKVAKMLLELRGTAKVNGTYVDGLGDKMFIDGKIHGSYNLTGTVTGRTSSNDPNMQNFPKRKQKWVREMVVPPPGHKILSFDYGQIEARLMGVVSGDKNFIDALWNDYDIHLENARELFGDARAKEMRPPVKNGTFALIYGAGNRKVAETTGATEEDIARLRELVFKKFPSFLMWQRSVASFEKANGYIESLFGKRRRSPISYNELLNFIPQSTASDMTLSAMVALGRRHKIAWMIHDDLSFFVPEEKVEDVVFDVVNTMLIVPWKFLSRSDQMKAYIPLSVEAEIGDDWGNLSEIMKVSSLDLGYDSLKKSLKAAKKYL